MKKLYEPPLFGLYSYAVEEGYAISSSTEGYGDNPLNNLMSGGSEGYGDNNNPPLGINGAPDPYVGENNPGGFWGNGTW